MARMADLRNIVILTGAGISPKAGSTRSAARAACGNSTGSKMSRRPRRSRAIPSWCCASTTCGARQSRPSSPIAAHEALGAARAGVDNARGAGLLIVTQNVDDLHERAGTLRRAAHAWHASQRLVHRLRRAQPLDRPADRPTAVSGMRRSARCGPTSCGSARCPTRWSEIYAALREADLFVSIGTSGAVYPAAGFVRDARDAGRADARAQSGTEPGLALVRRNAARPGERAGAGVGGGDARRVIDAGPAVRGPWRCERAHRGVEPVEQVQLAPLRIAQRCLPSSSTRIACIAAKLPTQPAMAPSMPSSAQVSQSSASKASPTKQR